MNCLEWCLDFWSKNRDYALFYNHNHVIAVKGSSVQVAGLTDLQYEELRGCGYDYFVSAFDLDKTYTKILYEYFNH